MRKNNTAFKMGEGGSKRENGIHSLLALRVIDEKIKERHFKLTNQTAEG